MKFAKKTLTILLLIAFILPFAAPLTLSAAETKKIIGFTSPAIPCDVGETVDLSKYSVELRAGETASEVVWSSDDITLDGTKVKAPKAGVYKLTAGAGTKSKTVYLVAKAPTDTEYVLYYADFSDTAFNTGDIRPINVTSGSTWKIENGKLRMDASGGTSKYVRLAFPSFLDDFGDYTITAVGTMTSAVNDKRWTSVVFRGTADTSKYYHTCIRQNATYSNGVEIAEHTASGWNVVSTGAFTEKLVASKFHTLTAVVKGDRVMTTVDGKPIVYFNVLNSITKGHVGLQVNGGIAEYKSFKVTLTVDEVRGPDSESKYASVKDPESNITLPPAVIASGMTDAGKIVASGAASAVFEVGDASKVGDMVSSLGMKVIPIFKVKDQTVAKAVAGELKRLDFPDAIIMSSDGTALSAARNEYNSLVFAYDMTDVTPEKFDALSMSVEANRSGCRIIILSKETATRANTIKLTNSFMTVWAVSDGTAVGDVGLITAGVGGIITPDPERTISCFTEFFLPDSIVRPVSVVAHRGLPTKYQENSLAGFIAACEAGATIVENDIQFSKDGVIIVMHDATIDRTTDGTGTISAMTYAEISKYRLCGDQNLEKQPIPTLEDYFIELEKHDVKLCIEIKSADAKCITELVRLIKKYDNLDKLIFISFKAAQLSELQRQLPGVSVGLLDQVTALLENSPAYSAEKILSQTQPMNSAFDAKYTLGLGSEVMKALSYRGLPYFDWTVNNAADFDRIYCYGVGGMTTNYADWMTGRLYTVQTDKRNVVFKAGESCDISVGGTTYDGKSVKVDAEMIVIDGTDAVKYNNGKISMDESGDVTVMFRTKTALPGGKICYLYSEPVSISARVAGTSSDTSDDAPGTTPGDADSYVPDDNKTAGCAGCGSTSFAALIAVLLVSLAIIPIKKK